jgi:hypothetical protein
LDLSITAQLELPKKGGKEKAPRMVCRICEKPGAVRYINKRTGIVTYEHRDEPAVSEYIYNGMKYLRYRRCRGGRVSNQSIEDIIEHGIQPRTKAVKSRKPIQEVKQQLQLELSQQNKQDLTKLSTDELIRINLDIALELSKRKEDYRSEKKQKVRMETADKHLGIQPIPIDTEVHDGKISLNKFFKQKHPITNYEKIAAFVYYITKINKAEWAKHGEVLYCYDKLALKRPSITDGIKNAERYKHWLTVEHKKIRCQLTESGKEFVEKMGGDTI